MSQNLKARLGRIRESGRGTTVDNRRESGRGTTLDNRREGGRDKSPATGSDYGRSGPSVSRVLESDTSWSLWSEAGFQTFKKKSFVELPFPAPAAFPKALSVLIPDISRIGRVPLPEELLFFDLETTGLSGGAGTLAFLAAFGRLPDRGRLEITQYLLLDYPGESDFIGQVAEEFGSAANRGKIKPGYRATPFVVSFNGKSFDSQILKNRCLMNGLMPPEYLHLDLLHPARRLWKRQLPDCSQATIEVSILGLDRTGDVSGAFAPDIWFSFLRSGDKQELLSVCDHNRRDIEGLASLFFAMAEIAAAPIESRAKFRFDGEALALLWRTALKRNPSFFGSDEKAAAEILLKAAADEGYPRAVFTRGMDLFRKGRDGEARTLIKKIADNGLPAGVPDSFRAAAFKSLAVDAEWRLSDPASALDYTVSALTLPDIPPGFRNELEKRCLRLTEKAVSG